MFILTLLRLGLHALEILILVRCVISFVPAWQRQPFGLLVIALTEPFLAPLRALTRIGGGSFAIDFSPMIVLFIIHAVNRLLSF